MCTFLEGDFRTSIGRTRSFVSDVKLRELIARTSTKLSLADHQALDQAIHNGRGGVFLDLNQEQYAKLKGGE